MALRNISRNLRRSLLSAVAITVSAVAIVFAFSFLNGIRINLITNVQNFVSGDIRIRHKDYDTYEYLSPLHLAVEEARRQQAQIEVLPEITQAAVRINFPALFYVRGNNSESIPVQGLGLDFAEEERFMEIGSFVQEGRLPIADRNEALIGEGFAKRHNLTIGDTITLLTTTKTRGSNAFTVQVVAIGQMPFNQVNNNIIFIPFERAQYFLRMGDAASEILIKRSTANSEEEALQAVQATLIGNNDARSWREIGLAYTYIQTATISYLIIALIFFLLASTVIINTTMMVIFERIREIGTLSAMGMNPPTLVRLFFLEALFISILGALIGTVGGSVLSAILGTTGIDMGSQLQGVDIEFSNIIYPRPTFLISLLVFIYSVIISALATLLPSSRSARIRPVEALRRV